MLQVLYFFSFYRKSNYSNVWKVVPKWYMTIIKTDYEQCSYFLDENGCIQRIEVRLSIRVLLGFKTRHDRASEDEESDLLDLPPSRRPATANNSERWTAQTPLFFRLYLSQVISKQQGTTAAIIGELGYSKMCTNGSLEISHQITDQQGIWSRRWLCGWGDMAL